MSDRPAISGTPEQVNATPDRELAALFEYLKNGDRVDQIGDAIREAIDVILDGRITGRIDIASADVDKVEKTFLGFKVEQLIRHRLELPHGNVFDYVWTDAEAGLSLEFDVKWSISRTFMIPQEAARAQAICLLVSADDRRSTFEAGLIRIGPDMLNGQNQDKKRSLKASVRDNDVAWIVRRGQLRLRRATGNARVRADRLRKGDRAGQGLAVRQCRRTGDFVRRLPERRLAGAAGPLPTCGPARGGGSGSSMGPSRLDRQSYLGDRAEDRQAAAGSAGAPAADVIDRGVRSGDGRRHVRRIGRGCQSIEFSQAVRFDRPAGGSGALVCAVPGAASQLRDGLGAGVSAICRERLDGS